MRVHPRPRVPILCLGLLWVFVLIGVCRVLPGAAASGQEAETTEAEDSKPSTLDRYWAEIKDSFEVLAKTIVYGAAIGPANSSQNPDNDFLNLPSTVGVVEARPDFSVSFWRINAFVKPRFRFQWFDYSEGELADTTDYDIDAFVNEWQVRLRLLNSLYASYGQENLQWGPSWFISPSNPFFRDNGQSNPKLEVPGMGFARLLWIPDTQWTLSFIANVNEGRQEFRNEDFEKVYALKFDYVTMRKYFSLIASYREDDRFRLGGYANWSASDALMVYAEGSLAAGTNARYPVLLADTPLGPLVSMDSTKKDDSAWQALILLGASYTLELGPTLTVEYTFNSAGYNDQQADLYYELRGEAARGLGSPIEFIDDLARFALLQTLDPGLRLLRKNYVMVQYRHSFIWNVMNLVFRYSVNLDDSSSQFIPIIEYDVGDHTQFFLIGQQTFGPGESEYRSLLDYSWMLGFEYTF